MKSGLDGRAEKSEEGNISEFGKRQFSYYSWVL
jgi:hypothetical protein